MRQTTKGFTLVELLVVIYIISLLSSVVLAAVNDARRKTDNAQRSKVVEEYRKAFILGYDKYNGYPYPGALSADYCLGNPPLGKCDQAGFYTVSATANGVVGEFLPSLPVQKPFAVGAATYYGPRYSCALSNGSTDNKGSCARSTISWYQLGDMSGAIPTKGCEPGIVAGMIASFPRVIICNLTLE